MVSAKRLYEWRSPQALLSDPPERFWSVTTIIKSGLPAPALMGWGMKSVAEFAVANHRQIAAMLQTVRLRRADGLLGVVTDPDAVQGAIDWLKGSPYRERDRKADLGTAVHAAAEAYIKQIPRPRPPDEVAAYVEGFYNFLEDHKPEYELAEATVYNRTESYAGTLDAVCRIPNRGTVLIDYKTSSGVYPDHALQLAAYRYAEFIGLPDGTEAQMPAVDGAAVLWLNPDADRGYDLIPVTADKRTFKSFLYVREVFRWAEEISKDVIGEALPKPGAKPIVEPSPAQPAKPQRSKKPAPEPEGVFA
jgi:hypothetical protein